MQDLESYARKMSIMLAEVLGGGSEWFTRIGDEFYVCPKLAGDELRSREAQRRELKIQRHRLERGKS